MRIVISPRRLIASAIDLCVALAPALAMVIWWVATIGAAITEGIGGLVYYGLPGLLFTGPVVIWVLAVARSSRGRTTYRSIGLVLAGLGPTGSGTTGVVPRERTVGGVALRAGATAIATLSVLSVGFEVVSIGAVIYGTTIG